MGHTIGVHLHHRSVCACEALTAAGRSHGEARPPWSLAIEQTWSRRRAVYVVGIVVEHDAVKAGAGVRISRWHGRFGLRRVDAAQHVPVVRIECRFVEWLVDVRGAVFDVGAALGQFGQAWWPWSRDAVAITKPGSPRARRSASRRAISRLAECTENSRTPKASVGKSR